MTFQERLQQKQAGTNLAPASGVSGKMLKTPYADAAKGNLFMQRLGRPSATTHAKQTSEESVSVLGQKKQETQKAPALDTGIPVLTSNGLTRLGTAGNPNASYIGRTVKEVGGMNTQAGKTASQTTQTEAATKGSERAAKLGGGNNRQKRTSMEAVNLAGETAGPVEVTMTPKQMQEEYNRVQKQIQDLDTAWRTQDTESPIMAAMYGTTANTMSREEYDRQRRELQEKADALETGYRTAKQSGPFTGTYARELNYAEDRESPLSVSHFAEIMNRADFAQKSQPGERAGGKVFTTSDQELYNYINDIDGARQSYDIRAIRGMGPEYAKYQLMTPEEIKVYNYYANSGDAEGLKEFLGWLEPQLNRQWYSGRQETMDEFVGQNAGTKALGSAATVLAQPARALTGAAATIQDIYRADRGLEIDPYSPLHQFNRLNQGIREEVGEDMSGAGQFLYNTVMSAADSAMNSLTASGIASTLGLTGEKAMEVTGKLGALLMSNEVVASSIAEAKDKGYSDVGAVVLGLLRGGIETASEMIGGEWAIKNIKAHPDQFLRTMLRNGIPEGLEENMSSALNEVVNLLIDNSYGTGESYIGQAYKHYREEGKENPGLWVVLTILEQEGLNFLGGSLSTVGTTGVQWKNYNTGLSMSANALHTDTGTVQQLMEELGTDNPAAVGYMAELADVSDVESFRSRMQEVDEGAEAIDSALQEQGQTEQDTEKMIDAPPVETETAAPEERVQGGSNRETVETLEREPLEELTSWDQPRPVNPRTEEAPSEGRGPATVVNTQDNLLTDEWEDLPTIDAQEAEAERDEARRQAWTEDGGVIPPVVGAEMIPTTPGTDPRQQEAAQLEAERQRAKSDQGENENAQVENGNAQIENGNAQAENESEQKNMSSGLDDISSTYIDTNPDTHTTEQMKTIREYIAAVDNGIKSFVQRVRGLTNLKYRNKVRYSISEVSNRAAAEILQRTGVDVTGYDNILTGSAVDHIEKRHGAQGKADHSMSNINDLARVRYVLDNFDGSYLLTNEDGTPSVSDVWKNRDNTPAQRVVFYKELDGVYYAVEAVPDSNAEVVAIESAFIGTKANEGSTGAVLNVADSTPQVTSETPQHADETFKMSIPDSAGNSNKNFSTENSRAELEREYKRRYDAYMAASDTNDTEFDYKGEIAWLNDAEKQIGKERAVQIANGEVTPGRTDAPVSIDQAEQELLDVGEAVVETENGKYRLQVRLQSNGDYMAKVFKDGGEQVARRFSTPEEAAAFASDYIKGQERGYQDAAEEAERSPEQEPEVPTELPDGREEERAYIRKKKNEAAKLSNQALRDRILRTQSQIDNMKRMDRNPGTRLTEQQRAHIEDLQETLDILVEESNARKQRAKDRKGKAKEAEAKNKESRNKATESTRTARSELMKLWHTADGNKARTADAINKALEEMRQTGKITEESRRKLMDTLMDAGAAAVEAESVFADIYREAKNRKVYVSEKDKSDFPDWKEFKQRAFAAGLWLTNDQNDKGADSLNEEMASVFGENLFPTNVSASDALENIVGKMEQGKPAKETLSDAIDRWAELEHTTRETILDDLNEKTNEILRTFAKKAELEVQLKDQTADMLQQERERMEKRIANMSQRRRETQIRDKVLRGLKRLERLKGRADPETKPAVEAVLKDIDTHAKSMSIERLEDLQALQRAYNDAREAAGWEDEEHPGNWIPNKYVEDRLAALSQKHLNEMDIQDVIDLGRTVLALENTIRTNGQMIGEEFAASVAETAQKVREEVESTKGTRGGFLNKWLMEEHLSPKRFLEHLAGWKNGAMSKLAKSLEDGQTRALDFQRRATQAFDPFLSKKENREWLEKASGKKATWTEYAAVDGMSFVGPSFTKIELTPMMKVSLYLHSLNNDNLRHIQNGGLVIPNKELYIKGDIKNAYEKGARVKMEPEVVRSIVKELTPQEMLFARYMQKVFNGVSKDAINEVSLQLDGFERAGVANYMPIESSRNFLKSDVTAEAREGTVEGIGSIANDRVGGTNPMVLDDASNVLTRQIDKVSRYYGYAIPIRNFQAVYNRVFPGENGESYASSMKEVLGRKWGSGSKQYIEKMLADLQSGGKSKNDPLSRAMSALRGHLAGATLSFNPAVAVSQTASYPGAAQAVGWDGLAHGLVAGRVDPKLIEKYSPLYWYRNQGNSTQELGDYMNGRSIDQKLHWALGWIQWMDSATIRRLWAASEYRVAKDNPNLQKGTQEEIDAGESEFYKKVAEVFNRAVYDTQPNYTTMERAQILRSESDVTRFLTMYKTVPLQYYGMMVEAAGRLQAARQSGNEAQVKQAQKYALNTFGGLLAANSVYVLMKALFKGFRRKDKDYRDEEGNLTAGSVSKQLGKDLAEVYAGSIIGGAEALSLAKYLIGGGTYHAPEMNALGYVEDMAGAVRSIITAMDSQDPRKAAGAIKDAAKTLAMGLGLPASNMETYLLSTIRWASPKVAMEYENMFGGIDKADLKGMDTKATGIATGLILSNRTGERFPESVSQELARLYEAGQKTAIPTDIPESFTYGDTEVEIKDRRAYSDAWGEAVGDSLEELLSTDYYQDADDKTKARIVDHLFDYATVQARRTADPDYDTTGNSTYGWTARAEEAVDNGADLAEAITAIVACNGFEADKDENGDAISGTKRAKIIKYLDGLNTPDDHRDALYMATLYSDKDAREKLEAVEDIGISQHTAITALNDMGSMSADKDADGKSIANSKRDKISTYIDAMDLSDSQKDELFVLMGYKETSLKYTPWHGYKITGSGSSSGRSGGSSSGRSGGTGKSSGSKSSVKIPSQTKAMGTSSSKSSKGAGGIQTSTAEDLIQIIEKYYGGNALAALVDDRPRGRTKVDFKL